jgi:hypothetical protein
VQLGLSPGASTYLEAHERVRALLRAHYAVAPADAFRLIVVG